MYPRLAIDLKKLEHNARELCRRAGERGVTDIAFVTKVFTADRRMVEAVAKSGCRYLADSRTQNLAAYGDLGKDRILLRVAMPSEAEAVVAHAEISFQSEQKTLRALEAAAERAGKRHKVVLMIDLGDLREGIFFRDTEQIMETVDLVEASPHLVLYGAAFNVTCYGSVLPTEENLGVFIGIVEQIEARIGRKLELISGGNSSSIKLMEDGGLPARVNNLRLGEALILGRETAYEQDLEGMYQDAVILEAEVVEVQTKPSHPVGELGVNATVRRELGSDISAACGQLRRRAAGVTPYPPPSGA